MQSRSTFQCGAVKFDNQRPSKLFISTLSRRKSSWIIPKALISLFDLRISWWSHGLESWHNMENSTIAAIQPWKVVCEPQSERPIFTRMVQRMTQIFASGITLIEGNYLVWHCRTRIITFPRIPLRKRQERYNIKGNVPRSLLITSSVSSSLQTRSPGDNHCFGYYAYCHGFFYWTVFRLRNLDAPMAFEVAVVSKCQDQYD